jgi:DedD protein
MDRPLKERLTGASILVLIAVLFIPELLSGPAKRAPARMDAPPQAAPADTAATMRTYTVDLNHPPSEASAVAASMANPDSAPAGAASAARVAQTPVPASAAPLEAPAAHPAARILPAEASNPQALHGGADMAGAARDAPPEPVAHEHAVEAQAPAARMPAKDTFAPIGSKGGWSIQLGSFNNRSNAEKLVRTMRTKGIRVYISSQEGKHRVRAGPFPDRATAERMGARLKSQGQAVTIIAP